MTQASSNVDYRLRSWFPGVRDLALYDRLVRAMDLVEWFAGSGYRGWEQGEFWALLGTPGQASWPEHIDAQAWPARVGRMLAPDDPPWGERQARELRGVLDFLGLAPIPDALGKKAREDRIQYLHDHHHIRHMPGRRWRSNAIRRLEHVTQAPKKGARLINDPTTARVVPVYVVGLRDDLMNDERCLAEDIGRLIEDLLGIVAYIQGYDKTGVEAPERPRASNRQPPWGTPRTDDDSAFGIIATAFGRVTKPGLWPQGASYLDEIQALHENLTRLRAGLAASEVVPSGKAE